MQDVIIQRHSESGFLAAPREVRRKPPASEQFNRISCAYDALPVLPAQLELDLSQRDGAILPDDRTVTLLATEDRAQSLVAGSGVDHISASDDLERPWPVWPPTDNECSAESWR